MDKKFNDIKFVASKAPQDAHYKQQTDQLKQLLQLKPTPTVSVSVSSVSSISVETPPPPVKKAAMSVTPASGKKVRNALLTKLEQSSPAKNVAAAPVSAHVEKPAQLQSQLSVTELMNLEKMRKIEALRCNLRYVAANSLHARLVEQEMDLFDVMKSECAKLSLNVEFKMRQVDESTYEAHMFLEGFRFLAAANKKKKRCKQDLFKKTFDILVSYNNLGLRLVDDQFELIDTLKEINGEAKVMSDKSEIEMEQTVVKKKIDVQSLFQMCGKDKVSLGDIVNDKEKM